MKTFDEYLAESSLSLSVSFDDDGEYFVIRDESSVEIADGFRNDKVWEVRLTKTPSKGVSIKPRADKSNALKFTKEWRNFLDKSIEKLTKQKVSKIQEY